MKPKTVCLDVRMLHASGIGTYLQGLLAGVRSKGSLPYSFSLIGDPQKIPQGPWAVVPASSRIYSLREQMEIPRAIKRAEGNLLHAPHYNLPWSMARQTIVTVHDLIHLKFPEYWPSLPARAYAWFFFHRVVPKAKAILTVSENTKRDLMELLGIPSDRITVTRPGVSHERFRNVEPASTALFDQMKLPKDYLLYVGNLKEFKNVQRLVKAYRQLASQNSAKPPLVMVGRNFIPGFEKELSQTPGIHWIGEVRSELLPCFYKNALAFLFPSLYEGFGLPPLEAMACGTPVICSNRASLPEVVGDAALLINPDDTEALADAMRRLIDDSSLRKELSSKGLARAALFSWDDMTTKTLEVYERCLE